MNTIGGFNTGGTPGFGGGLANNTSTTPANTNTSTSFGSGGGFSFGGNTGNKGTGFTFGSSNNATTGTTTNNNTANKPGGFSFGNNTSTTSSGFGFGGTTNNTSNAAGTNNATTQTGGFGSGTTGQSTGFGFGNAGNKTTTGFGSTNTTTGFGSTNTTTSFGSFGSNTGTTFGSNTTNTGNTGGFGFNNNANKTSGFGSGTNTFGSGTGFGGFGSNNNNNANANQQPTVMVNLSENKELLDQMGKPIESLPQDIQKEIENIKKLLDDQQKVINGLVIPDKTTCESSLSTLQDLQFQCENIKASQDLYSTQLQSLKATHARYEAFVHQVQQATKENKEGEGIGVHSRQNQMPSVFFEEILKGLETRTNDLAERIENMEIMLSVKTDSSMGETASVVKEMSDTERLLNVLEREYNQFLIESSCVAELKTKMEEVKKRFLALRNKEIETRRKNMTLMVSMNDVLANVLDDPFKECATQFSKLIVC